jgi:hypothetical protein
MMRILAGLMFCCYALSGQGPAKPDFEVASIKPSRESDGPGSLMRMGGRGGPGGKDPTRYTAEG